MSKKINHDEVERIVRNLLSAKGYVLSPPKKNGQTGADIVAQKEGSTCIIEIIGFESNPPTRSRDFYEAFFRAISRDTGNVTDTLTIALPKRFVIGMPQRKRQYPLAWGKLGSVFPNLRLWYVDTEKETIEEVSWTAPYK